ncbi:MAG: hypothetical protein LBK52_03995 [Deltaproteobacteria bacterium]|jgi:hypothetical protein|nr:hypothetical protein [Deltaproteobacteria bacterium]
MELKYSGKKNRLFKSLRGLLKHRLAVCLFLGVLLIAAFFRILAFLDPNTLVNSRDGFQLVLDRLFGPGSWRAGSFSYSYQDRTMTVSDLTVTFPGPDISKNEQLLIRAEKISVSQLAWVRDLRSLDRTNPPPRPLAARAAARGVSFLKTSPLYRLEGRIELIDLQEISFAPGPGSAEAAASGSFARILQYGLQPEQVRLESLRLSARRLNEPYSLLLNLPSWKLHRPRLEPDGLRSASGSHLSGAAAAVSWGRLHLAGRLDEAAHEGLLAFGQAENISLQSGYFWLDSRPGPASLERLTRKNLPPAAAEIALGDLTAKKAGGRNTARRIQAAFQAGAFPESAGFWLNMLSAGDLFLGGWEAEDLTFRDLAVKTGILTASLGQGRLSASAGEAPGLTASLEKSWFSLSEPEEPQGFWSDFQARAREIDLPAGRFALNAEGRLDPKGQTYKLSARAAVENVMDLSISLELAGITGLLQAGLGRASLAETAAGRPAEGFKDAAVTLFEARLNDQGLVNRVLDYYSRQTPARKARDAVIFGLNLAAVLKLEKYLDNSQEIGDHLARFAARPGILILKAAPSPPVSFRGFQAASTLGDLLDSARWTLTLDSEGPLNFKWKKPWPRHEGPADDGLDWLERPDRLG